MIFSNNLKKYKPELRIENKNKRNSKKIQLAKKNTTTVSYTHLTLPTNREV